MTDRRRTPRCFDTLRGNRCRLPLGHEGFHAAGSHTWGFRDVPRALWLTHPSNKDLTPWAPR